MEIQKYKIFLCFFGIIFVAAFFAPEILAKTTVEPANNGTIFSGIDDKIGIALISIVDNLNDSDGMINELANVIWKTVAFILFVWVMFSFIWGEATMLGITRTFIYIAVTWAVINAKFEGQLLITYLTLGLYEGIVGTTNQMFELSTGGLLYSDFIGWLTLFSVNNVIVGASCTVFCIEAINSAIAGAIVTLAFGLMTSLSFIIRIMTQIGLAIVLSVGVVLVPLVLFDFGKALFFGWLKAVISLAFSLWFIYIILGLIANIFAAYLGVKVAVLTPNYYSIFTLKYNINSFDDVWAPVFISLVGIISIIMATKWGSMIGGNAVSAGGSSSASSMRMASLLV